MRSVPFAEYAHLVTLVQTASGISDTIITLLNACGCASEIVFFAIDDNRCGFDWGKRPGAKADGTPDQTARGHPFNYFTQVITITMTITIIMTIITMDEWRLRTANHRDQKALANTKSYYDTQVG